jgi:hypothetical protein
MTTLQSHLHSLSIVTCSTGLPHRFAAYRLSFPLQTRICQTHAWGRCFYSTTWRVRVSLTGTLSCQGSMTLPLIPCTLRYNFERTGRTHRVRRTSAGIRPHFQGSGPKRRIQRLVAFSATSRTGRYPERSSGQAANRWAHMIELSNEGMQR